jgi:hypothetical protein
VGIKEAIGGAFSFLRIRSSAEDRIAQYVIREHHRGRPLTEILQDHYVTNRCSPEQIGRILERNDVIHAVGDDIIASARTAT